jgi:hypothetical protein
VLNPVVGLVNLGRKSLEGWDQLLLVSLAAGVVILLTHWLLERKDLIWGAR